MIIQGDIGAVQAAIETGEATARKIGKVLSVHVIARTDEGIQNTFLVNETLNNP
ncbi:BMC domain-containing protein [Lysinibacillus endophyticus]|uniref:BMC domain-containing protein n=1 Tax=Ureibacillus endophyticus TaxID=1978490 RepID=UPI00345031DA